MPLVTTGLTSHFCESGPLSYFILTQGLVGKSVL